MNASERLSALVDAGSYRDIDGLEVDLSKELKEETVRESDGVLSGTASVSGRRVVVFSQVQSYRGGSIGKRHARRIRDAVVRALELHSPLIGFYDSGGARVQEGVASLAETAGVLKELVAAKGRIPQFAAVLGTVSGGAAYAASLADFLVMVQGKGRMFVWGPGSVKVETGRSVTAEELGGSSIHTKNGAVTVLSKSEDEAVDAVKHALNFMLRAEPRNPRKKRGSGGMPLIESLVDSGSFYELQGFYAANVTTGLARLDGRGVGVVATNKGFLDVDASKKVTKFVAMCNAMNLPVITLLDTPGFYPSIDQERRGLIEASVQLATVYSKEHPLKVTVVTGEVYGGAFVFLASKTMGVRRVYAFPKAKVSVLGLKHYVEVFVQKKVSNLRGAKRKEEFDRMVGEYAANMDPKVGVLMGYLDGVITQSELRRVVSRALVEPSTPPA
jgi:acetyl-CoA carboxylase carboxyltransferase component